MYLRPAATDITYVDDLSAIAHFGRSVVVVDSPQTTENIIGYVILAIAVALVLVGFIAAAIIRRCCAYFREMRQHWRRRKTRRRITSSVSSTAPIEKARISTTTVLRSDHSEKTDTAFSSPPTNKVFADLPPYSHEHEINHHELSDNNNNGTVSSLVRSPLPVHVNAFNDPRRNPPFQIHGDGMEDSVGSVNDLSTPPSGSGLFLLSSVTSSIRPHGIPLTPLPEDASAVFPMPYSEADEQTLYGSIGSESDHDHYPGLVRNSQ